MIDFHSHILPGIDDGSRNTQMSMEMLEKSASYGIDTMVATPHFYIRHNVPDRFLKNRSAAYDKVMEACEKHKGINPDVVLPDIKLGAEVYYFQGISKYEELRRLTINNTDYLLLEMPFDRWNTKVLSDVEAIIDDLKLKPIIAHIERYVDANKGTSYIRDLLTLEVIIQSNGEFFNGFFSRRRAVEYLNKGIIQLLGSDCHNMDRRAPNLDKTYEIIKKKCGEEVLEKMDKLGRSILGGNA
jgi:protein-tyrosine phosphatase